MNFARPYRPLPEAEARRASAIRIAELVVAADGLIDTHRKQLLSIAIWKVTEADRKYNLRYRSKAVLALPPGATRGDVIHEHVFPRSVLIAAMLAEPNRVAEILTGALACLVTKEEHARLARASKTADGWKRYRATGIDVVDMQDGKVVSL